MVIQGWRRTRAPQFPQWVSKKVPQKGVPWSIRTALYSFQLGMGEKGPFRILPPIHSLPGSPGLPGIFSRVSLLTRDLRFSYIYMI